MAVLSRTPPRVALFSGTFNTYSREAILGIHDYLLEHKPWSIYLAEHGRNQFIPDWLQTWKGDGIIARVEDPEIAKAIRQTGLPAVDLAFGTERAFFPRVIMDNYVIAKLAAEHLMGCGFSMFAYCGLPQHYWSRYRGDLFRTQIEAAGYKCENFAVPIVQKACYTWELEVEAIVKWLTGLPKPVGILACVDDRGAQVLEACRRSNISVPDEVAVMGVHNDELVCEICDPPLSSVVSNPRRVGYEAASLLDRIMAGEHIPAQTILFEPTGVAARQSTDVVAVKDPHISKAVRFIREHAAEGITVEDVLRAVPMSRTVFERRFKKLLHRTPHDHILRARIQRVKTLLTGTKFSLAEIAERTGFEHIEYLSVVFKRTTGDTPSNYRQRHSRRWG